MIHENHTSDSDRSSADAQDERLLLALTADISTDSVWGSPLSSDADFVVAVHRRIHGDPILPRRVFVIPKLVPVAVLACVALLATVFSLSQIKGKNTIGLAMGGIRSNVESPLVNLTAVVAEVSVGDEETAADLADFLDLPRGIEVGEIPESSIESSVTDELLALDESSRNEILSELERTEFF